MVGFHHLSRWSLADAITSPILKLIDGRSLDPLPPVLGVIADMGHETLGATAVPLRSLNPTVRLLGEHMGRLTMPIVG
jgi:hypothetical protein